VSSISTHGPQYLQSYAGLSAGTATFLAGLVIVPAATIGTLIGGFAESTRHKSLVQVRRAMRGEAMRSKAKQGEGRSASNYRLDKLTKTGSTQTY